MARRENSRDMGRNREEDRGRERSRERDAYGRRSDARSYEDEERVEDRGAREHDVGGGWSRPSERDEAGRRSFRGTSGRCPTCGRDDEDVDARGSYGRAPLRGSRERRERGIDITPHEDVRGGPDWAGRRYGQDLDWAGREARGSWEREQDEDRGRSRWEDPDRWRARTRTSDSEPYP